MKWGAAYGLSLAMMAALCAGTPGPAAAQIQLTPQAPRQTPTATPTGRRDPSEQRPSNQAALGGNFPRRLDQAAIRARFFDGRPVFSRALGGEVFTLTFFPDGRAERRDAHDHATQGRWRFIGDAYCSRWGESRTESCHTIVEDRGVIKVVRNTRAVATWSRDGTPPPP